MRLGICAACCYGVILATRLKQWLATDWLPRVWVCNILNLWATTLNQGDFPGRLVGANLPPSNCGPIQTVCNCSQTSWRAFANIRDCQNLPVNQSAPMWTTYLWLISLRQWTVELTLAVFYLYACIKARLQLNHRPQATTSFSVSEFLFQICKVLSGLLMQV